MNDTFRAVKETGSTGHPYSYEPILTKDASSGRIHERVRRSDGRMYVQEGCNLDSAGFYSIGTADDLANAEPGQLCENDFPPIGEPDEAA